MDRNTEQANAYKNQPFTTGFLVCSRHGSHGLWYFPTQAAMESWINEDPTIRSYYEYLPIDHEVIRNTIVKHGYSTYVWKKVYSRR